MEEKKKICTQCGKELPISQYYKNGNRRQSCCVDCYKANIKRAYDEKVTAVSNYKQEKGCRKCGEKRPYLLDFHHRNPKEKDFVISNKARCGLETMIEEINKCDVLCANCHREWHYLVENNLINKEDYEEWAQSKAINGI